MPRMSVIQHRESPYLLRNKRFLFLQSKIVSHPIIILTSALSLVSCVWRHIAMPSNVLYRRRTTPQGLHSLQDSERPP